MTSLPEPDRITLAEGLALLEGHFPVDQAKASLRRAFVQKTILTRPMSAFSYEGADIDWVTGAVRMPRRKGPFTPTFSRQEFKAHFFGSQGMWALSGSRLSRRTVFAAIEVIEGALTTQATLTRCFLKWDAELATRCDAGSLKDRCNHLMKFVDEEPARRTADGELLQDAIINEAILLLSSYDWGLLRHHAEPKAVFMRALDLDGFTVREGALIRTLPAELELPRAEDDITRLLTKHGFATLKGHLDQALDAHARGSWASANAQLRTFYEGLFDEIATRIEPSAADLTSSENRRARLADIGFLSEDLNEWGNGGKNFVNGLLRRLHPAGSHLGLSDQDDSTFRRHVVLLAAKLFLVRFDTWAPTL